MNVRIKTAVISIFINIVLVVFKFYLSSISGSASLHADAWHSISDLCVSAFVLAGLRISSGGGRKAIVNWRGFEDVIALGVGAFILYTGIRIFGESVKQGPQVLSNIGFAIAGAFLCVLISYLLATMKINIGRLHNSPSLVADGYHSKMDMYSTIAVGVGLFGVMIGIDIDRTAAAFVAAIIVLTGVEIIVSSIRAIAGGAGVSDYFISLVFERRRRGGAVGRLAGTVLRTGDWLRAGRRYAYVVPAVVIGLWAVTGFYALQVGEEGLVFRFGKLSRYEISAGLHYRIPMPFERLIKVPVGMISRVELGFRSKGRGTASARAYQWESRHLAGSYEKRLDESLIFTGDENIIDMNTVIQYRISEPVNFILNVEDHEAIVRSAAEATLRQVISTTPIDELLTTGRSRVEAQVLAMLQKVLDNTAHGIEVVTVKLQDVHPPYEVVSAFREVASAREDKNRMINQALAYRDSLIPETRGLASKLVAEAHAETCEVVQHARGESDRFVQVLEQYDKAKDVTELRLYLETMERVLPGLEKFIVEPEAGETPLDLRFFDESAMGIKWD
jgi:membrane protease subunit HflK